MIYYNNTVVAFFTFFSQTGVMVSLIYPERMELESCACAHIEILEVENARGEGGRRFVTRGEEGDKGKERGWQGEETHLSFGYQTCYF